MKRLFHSFLSWLLKAPRPQSAPSRSDLLAVTIETEAAGYLHTQLRLNIRQKERIQAFVPFRLQELIELKALIPNQSSLVFMTLSQHGLLKGYVEFYWDRAEDAGLRDAYGELREELFFKDPHRLIA